MARELSDTTLVRVLKALADPHRFRMVQEIAEAGELNCGQLGNRFPLSQPTVSHHLKILADAGILQVRRQGQHGLLSVNRKLLDAVLGRLPGRLREARPRPRNRRRAEPHPG